MEQFLGFHVHFEIVHGAGTKTSLGRALADL